MKAATQHRKFPKALIVGAGGIGCHLVPMLSLTHDIVIMDGDSYEPKNAARQFPALTSTRNKAEALSDQMLLITNKIPGVIPEYLQGLGALNVELVREADIIFGAVDNNTARRTIMELADAKGCPAILGGNDELEAEAHLYLPGEHDPREFFAFKTDSDIQPWACNADQVIEERPQTVTANVMAAAACMQILSSLVTVEKPENILCAVRMDNYGSTTRRVRNFRRRVSNGTFQKEDPWMLGEESLVAQAKA